ncbi:MAG: peptidyl-prolyl cis-trans isomerase SurA [Verrucomicrobiales bacterium]|jgi:peptidyl-prolyl cis-trans isomerase SurA
MLMMKKLRVLLPLLVFTVATVQAQSAERVNGIAAVIDGTRVVTKSEVREAVTAQTALLQQRVRTGQMTANDYQATVKKLETDSLDSLIERELILREFEKLNGEIKAQYIDEDIKRIVRDQFDGDRGEFLEELKTSNISLRKFRQLREKMLVVQMMRQRETGDIPPPTPEQRDAYLKENSDRFREKDYIKLRTITVLKTSQIPGTTPEKQKKLIGEIRSRLAKGADFEIEAKTYSQDSRSDHGGDWGWIDRETLKKALSDAAFKLSPKTLSQIVEDNRSYYILYVEAKRPGALKPMAEIQDNLEKMIKQEERKKRHDAWIARLREKATIKVND